MPNVTIVSSPKAAVPKIGSSLLVSIDRADIKKDDLA
jgi:hypothetical protein